MSENIYRLTKTEIDKLNRTLRSVLDHLNESGEVITEDEADSDRRSGKPLFCRFSNGYDDAKVAEEVRRWSGHDRIHVEHAAGQRRALYGNLYKIPTPRKKYYTPAIEHVEKLKDDVTRKFLSVHDCFGKLEMRVKELDLRVGKLELADKYNDKR